MGKRSDFERKPKDYYPTPRKAVLPLLPHLPSTEFTFIEPCAGDGRLISHIEELSHGVCIDAYDIEPRSSRVKEKDARQVPRLIGSSLPEMFITNPPWSREAMHGVIEALSSVAKTWLLIDADWAHTKQAHRYLLRCSSIVSVGRVSWEGNGISGKDNCAWYCFENKDVRTEFFGWREKTYE